MDKVSTMRSVYRICRKFRENNVPNTEHVWRDYLLRQFGLEKPFKRAGRIIRRAQALRKRTFGLECDTDHDYDGWTREWYLCLGPVKVYLGADSYYNGVDTEDPYYFREHRNGVKQFRKIWREGWRWGWNDWILNPPD